MTTAGPRYPTTVSTASVSTESANDWLTASNIGADDGSEAQITAATYDSPDISFRLIASNFGFTIPTGATIDGITVAIDRRCFAGSARDFRVQLQDEAAALVGNNKATATAWPATLGIATYGGAADKWNWTTVTPTKLNDPDFGVVLSVEATAANTDIGVDFIRVTVDYTVTITTFERSAAISATAVAESTGTFFSVFERSSDVSATAALASTGTFFSVFERASAISATAAVASSGESETPAASHERSAGLSATAAVATTGQRELLRSSALAASATVATAGQRDLLRASAVGATATVQAGSMRDLIRSAALSGSAWVSTAAVRDVLRSATVAATGAITVSGEIVGQAQEHERPASFTATAAIATSGHRDPSQTGGSSGSSGQAGGGVTNSGVGGISSGTGTSGGVTITGRIGG